MKSIVCLVGMVVATAGFGVACARVRVAEERRPQGAGVTLVGRITDEAGNPVENVKVQLYSGLATRWPGQAAVTDAQGEYRVEKLETGAMTMDEQSGRWDYYVGMRLEHPEFVPADGSTWLDITVPTVAGTEFRQDFTMTRGGTIDMTLATAAGRGLGDFEVRLMRMEGENQVGTEYATTDRKGHFITPALFPGEWSVQWNWGAANYAELARVTVEPGKGAERTVKLKFEVEVVE